MVVLAALGALVHLADTECGSGGRRARRAEARVVRVVAAVGTGGRAVRADLREHVPVAVVHFGARRRRPVFAIELRHLMFHHSVNAYELHIEIFLNSGFRGGRKGT